MKTIVIKIEDISPNESNDNLKEMVESMLEGSYLYEYLSYPIHTINIEEV